MPNAHPKLIQLIPLLFVFLWSTGFVGAKYALPFIEPFYLLFIRMVFTIIVFFALCMVFRARWPSRRLAGHQMVSGALIHGAYLGGVFAAIKLGMPAGVAAIIVGIQPILTALISWQFLNETLKPMQWLGLALGFVGVVVVISSTQLQSDIQITWPALLATAISLVGISAGTLYQKRVGGGVDLLTGSFWQYVSTAILMGILAWSFESREVVWDIQLILALTWLVFGLSVSAVLLLMYMIREGEASKVAAYFYLVPLVACIEAWLLFDEELPIVAVAAILLTVLGVYLVLKKPASTQ